MLEQREDLVRKAIGDWGRWQLVVCLSLSLTKVPAAWNQLGIVFLAPPVHHWCDEPASNVTDACSVYLNDTEAPCTRFRYDRSTFTETIITEWNLVCGRRQLASAAQSVVMLGSLVGELIFGMLADRLGRKMTLIFAVAMQLLTGSLIAFVPWFPVFLTLRLLLAVSVGGSVIISFVICMEILGGKWRRIVSILYHLPYFIGHVSLVGFAYLTREWHSFQLITSLPVSVLLFYWCIVPESPRWLLAVGRSEEAAVIMQAAARKNKLNNIGTDNTEVIRRTFSIAETKETEPKANILDLFRTSNLRTRTLCMFFIWFICNLNYFGLSQYIGQEDGNIFLNVTISAIIGLPGLFICMYCTDKFGRKKTLIAGNIVGGVSCLLIMAVPQDSPSDWGRIALTCVGIVAVSTSFPTAYLFAGELFPTVVRSVGIGCSSMCGRIGGVLAPFVLTLDIYSKYLPPVLFGATPLAGALLCVLLPETANAKLPDTIEEGENFGNTVPKETEQHVNLGFVIDSAPQ